jgi:dihydropyrimidinase
MPSIVLIDPDQTWTIRATEQHSQAEYTLYKGRDVTGRVRKVFPAAK